MRQFERTKRFLAANFLEPPPTSLGRRVGGMIALWLAGGILVGVILTPKVDAVAVIANAIAGAIILPIIGLALGLVGGRWNETLLGGIGGLSTGMAAAVVTPGAATAALVSVGMICGGAMGAMLPLFLRFFKRVAASLPSATR